jgi:hypothetical protein
LLGQERSLSTSTRGESFGFLTQTNEAGTGIVWPPASGRTNRKHLGLRIEVNGEIRNHFQHAQHEMKRVSSEREPTSDERDYERIVVAELRRTLPEGEGIKRCEGFKHLGVQCCDTCHNFYPHDEMSVIDLPDGGKGRVCDPVKWAIYPEEYQKLEEWSRNSPEGKLLRQILGLDTDNN